MKTKTELAFEQMKQNCVPTLDDRRFARVGATNWLFTLFLILFACFPCCFGQTNIRPAEPRDVVSTAIQKLAAAPNYSWHQTFEESPASNRGLIGRPLDGKAQSDGLVWTSQDTIEKFTKDQKRAVKEQGGKWQAPEERFPARVISTGPYALAIPPAWQLTNILFTVQNVKESNGCYVGDLQPADAKMLVIYGGTRGGGVPATQSGSLPASREGQLPIRRGGGVSGTQSGSPVSAASVSFWVKDGALSKYCTKLTLLDTFNGNQTERTQTTTVEIKDVGTTKIDVPDEVKKILE
jgi:hypothetical protein